MTDIKKSFAKALNKPAWLGEDILEKIKIDDLPILITNDGTVVCIKKRDEVSSICIVGESGRGKSLLLHQLCEGLYYHWGDNVAIMNDYGSETLSWSEPQNNVDFIKESFKVNILPTSLPMVYLFPNTNTLDLDEEILKYKNYVRVTLPIKEVLNNLSYYFKSIVPEFELGQSTIYAQELKDSFLECETTEDIFEVIDNGILDDRSLRGVKQKIRTAFKSIFEEEILNITNPDAPSFLKMEGFLNNPVSTILYSQAIPSLMTGDLAQKKYRSAVISYYVNSIFKNQQLPEFIDKKTYLVFDELTTICSTEDRTENPCKASIINVVARGRINRLGIIYATQFYNKIPHEIKSAKMSYCVIFRQTTKAIARDVCKDFNLPDDSVERLQRLNSFECIAVTNEEFVCYKGDKKWQTREAYRGRLIPPTSRHTKA